MARSSKCSVPIMKHEAERVTGELIAHHFVNKTEYKDYAILYRGNHQSRVFEKMLMQNRIPYKISGGTSFFSRPEIKICWLSACTHQPG